MGQVLSQVCVVWPVLQHFHCTYRPQFSGLVGHSNGIINTQLAKFVEALQMPWLKAFSLVLLNLRGSPFGTHELSPIEIVTGCPIHLASDSFDP